MMGVVPNDLAVDSAGDAILQLEVHLGDGVVGEDGGIGDITYGRNPESTIIPVEVYTISDPCGLLSEVHCIVQIIHLALPRTKARGGSEFVRWRSRRTDGSGLNHVTDGESLDGLVLGDAASAVGAAHGLNVTAAVLVAAAVKLLVIVLSQTIRLQVASFRRLSLLPDFVTVPRNQT